jgi:hypothetical protein
MEPHAILSGELQYNHLWLGISGRSEVQKMVALQTSHEPFSYVEMDSFFCLPGNPE